MNDDVNQNTKEHKVTTEGLKEAFSIISTDSSRFIDKLAQEAIALSSSDILFEPRDEYIQVRIRIDGVLYEVGDVGSNEYPQIASRLKVLCNLDPTEKRKGQESQFSIVYYI